MGMGKETFRLGRRDFLFAAGAVGTLAAAATASLAEETVNPEEMKKAVVVDISALPRVKQKLVAQIDLRQAHPIGRCHLASMNINLAQLGTHRISASGPSNALQPDEKRHAIHLLGLSPNKGLLVARRWGSTAVLRRSRSLRPDSLVSTEL